MSIIGTEQLTQLVLATSVMAKFEKIREDLMDMKSFWCHSIATGLGSKIVAETIEEYEVEYYFVLGLLHDIGRLVMCDKIPEKVEVTLEMAKEEDEPLFEKERRILGFDHADVGGALLRI